MAQFHDFSCFHMDTDLVPNRVEYNNNNKRVHEYHHHNY